MLNRWLMLIRLGRPVGFRRDTPHPKGTAIVPRRPGEGELREPFGLRCAGTLLLKDTALARNLPGEELPRWDGRCEVKKRFLC